jgi:hypothetical protein
MATSWAALWPVFLTAAVQQSMTVDPQVSTVAAAAGHVQLLSDGCLLFDL